MGICEIMVRRIPLAILTGTLESVNSSWSFTVLALDTVGFPRMVLNADAESDADADADAEAEDLPLFLEEVEVDIFM
jgi:hypothetical protein